MLGINTKAASFTWTAAMVLLAICLVYLIRQTLFIFVIALMFAYLLYPLLDWIEKRVSWRTRTTALVITFILVLTAIGLFTFFVGSNVGSQATQLAEQIRDPNFAKEIRNWRVLNVPLGEQIVQHYNQILGMVPQISLQVLSASRNLIYLVIIPILSFFILKDGREIRESFLDQFSSARKTAEDTLADAHTLLLQYMRALLLLCLATLTVFSIVLTLIGAPYPILLATIAFPLEFVPLIGPLIAAAIIIGVTAFSGSHVIAVVIFLGIYRIFQDYVLSPQLMSRGVELHPMLVIFGVFAGGEIGGVPGVFLSVPALALIRLLWHHLRRQQIRPLA